MKILGISGSLRRFSHNTQLLQEARRNQSALLAPS